MNQDINKLKSISTGFVLVVVFSCKHYPILSEIYQTNVSIFTGDCDSCTSPNGGIDLSNYANVKAQLDNGKLMGLIEHFSGYVAMPYNSAKPSDC